MPLPQREDYTVEDIYALPEGTRAELIDGQIYYMAPPSRRHQNLLFSISRVIADLAVICDTSKLNDRGCSGAPDWIIEIVSPASRKMDYFTKLFKYRTAGVREYWIVDPVKNLILIYNFDTSDSEQYTFTDTIKAGIYEDLYIDFSRIK